MILIHRTYEIISEESAAIGEVEAAGFISENEAVTFIELIKLLKSHFECSNYPTDSDINTWFISNGDADYITGNYENTGLHYSRDNSPSNEKYWEKAVRYVHKVK